MEILVLDENDSWWNTERVKSTLITIYLIHSKYCRKNITLGESILCMILGLLIETIILGLLDLISVGHNL